MYAHYLAENELHSTSSINVDNTAANNNWNNIHCLSLNGDDSDDDDDTNEV